jgi:tRNA pseudouridine38-40 synthase
MQENAITVQEEVNKALTLILREKIETTGCGRTDTGVHAKQYTAHFDCVGAIEDFPKLKYKLNTLLSRDIAVTDIYETYLGFHSRFDAIKRTYKYFIHTQKNPFENEYSTFISHDLNVDAMNDAAKLLTGKKDFTSFCKLHTNVSNNYCTVFEAYWIHNADKYVFTISANRFLRNMVRAIVGTMLDAGRNKTTDITEFEKIIEAKDRSKAGVSAPPQGLFLWKNEYPQSVGKNL